jgi:hypothetical protein
MVQEETPEYEVVLRSFRNHLEVFASRKFSEAAVVELLAHESIIIESVTTSSEGRHALNMLIRTLPQDIKSPIVLAVLDNLKKVIATYTSFYPHPV